MKNKDRYQKDRREAMAYSELIETLERHKCATFLKVRNKLLIPQEGTCVLNRSLWVDGRYVGVVEKLLVPEDDIPDLSFPEHQAQKLMPLSEYEFIYHKRGDHS